MSVGQKLSLGFLAVVALMAMIGYFGIQTTSGVRETFRLEEKVDHLLLTVTEMDAIVSAIISANSLDNFELLVDKLDDLQRQVDELSAELANSPELGQNPDFGSFLEAQASNQQLHARLVQNREELLTRQDLFGGVHPVEESLRQRLRSLIYDTNDIQLVRDYGLLESQSKAFLYQFRDTQNRDVWLQSIQKVTGDVRTRELDLGDDQKRRLLDQLLVYEQTAKILAEITLREEEIRLVETQTTPQLLRNEGRMTDLRNDISARLEEEVRASYRRGQRVLVATTLATLGLSLIIGLFISRSVSRPISQLRNAAVRIGAGDLDTRVRVKSRDETGILARSFNEMAQSLQSTTVSKDYVDNIMTSMADTLIVTDPQGIIRTTNQSARRLLGYTEDEILGMAITRVLLLDSPENGAGPGEAPPGAASGAETYYITNKGEVIPISCSTSVMRDRHGAITGRVFVAQDITERKRAEQALQRQYDENARLLEAEHARSQERQALFELASILAEPGSYPEKTATVLRHICRLGQAGSGTMRVADTTEPGLRLLTSVGWDSARPLVLLPYSDSLPGESFRRGHPIVANDYPNHLYAQPNGIDQGIKSMISLPIKARGLPIGVITLSSQELGHFDPVRVALLTAVGNELGVLLENARLYEELQASTEEMALVDRVARIITSTLDINEVNQVFTGELKKLVDFDRATINLIHRDQGTCSLDYLFGSGPGPAVGSTWPLTGSAEERVLQSGVTFGREVSASPQEPVDASASDEIPLGFRANIVVPLISTGQVMGTLSLHRGRREAYGPREKAILERLASQISPAIENSRHYQQAREEMALVDQVAQVVTSTLDLEEVYQKFAEELNKLVSFERMNVSVIDPEARTYTLKYLFGPTRPGHPVGKVSPLADTQTSWVARTGQPIIRDDISGDLRYSADRAFEALGLRSNIMVPLASKGVVIGAMSLRSSRVGAYGPREQAVLERLAKQIAPAIENAKLYEERKKSEEELRKLSRAVEQSTSAVLITNTEGEIQYVNPRFTQITGYSPEDALGQNPSILKSGEMSPEVYRELWESVRSGQEWRGQLRNRRKSGELYLSEQSISPIRDVDGKITHLVGTAEDITDRKQLEEQFLQSQKMETVGQLAGGVAHDFNNLLTAIMGYNQMALVRCSDDAEVQGFLLEAISATDRASNLTNQLLAFSRRQIIAPKVIDLNQLILNLEKMLRRLIGEDIDLATQPAPGLAAVKVDPGQVEQLLMNLVVNARDAMPRGGNLTIKTGHLRVDQPSKSGHADLPVGDYVVLEVTDTGHGMPKEIKDRIFEPFFTTKGVGAGTGLGLSTCYGIATQNGGDIQVESEPGCGTTFRIFLPATSEGIESPAQSASHREAPPGTETVLLAEDEPMVRKMVVMVLRDRSYRVLEAADGVEALAIARSHSGKIDLLVTDVVMPNLGGLELAERLRASQPGIKVLFTSGYTEGAMFRQAALPSGTGFQQKPYKPEVLAAKVREVLDR